MEALQRPSAEVDRVYGNFDGEIEPAGRPSTAVSSWALLSNQQPTRTLAEIVEGIVLEINSDDPRTHSSLTKTESPTSQYGVTGSLRDAWVSL